MPQPDITLPVTPLSRLRARVPEGWRVPLLHLCLAWVFLIAVFWRDWAVMASHWWHSTTYNHVLFIPFILGWLVILRAPQLVRLQPMAWWPGLLVVAAAMLLWLLGALAGINLACHLAVVGMMQGAVLAMLGPRVAAGLIFPLGYMLFMVPFGDELVPSLQMITAVLTIAFTRWSGIPADIEGVFIDTPVGLFEVAEACSGVKFLVAMAALSTLVAQMGFRGWKRRVGFVLAALAVSILANGVRAWGTVYIAQFRGIEFAAGFDHILYGWFFFAFVIALVLGLAWRFFDRAPDEPMIDAAAIDANPLVNRAARLSMKPVAATAGIGMLALLISLWAMQAGRLEAQMPDRIALPDVAGWQVVDYHPMEWWEPEASGADHRLLGRYADSEGRQVDVFFALYAAQSEGREAGGFGQGALMLETPWRWLQPGPADLSGKGEWLRAHGHVRRLAITSYRTGDLLTGSNTRLKLANMHDRLLLVRRPTALLILSAEERPGHPATESVRAFRASVGDIGAWMDHIAQNP